MKVERGSFIDGDQRIGERSVIVRVRSQRLQYRIVSVAKESK